jgi:hypothetical protein
LEGFALNREEEPEDAILATSKVLQRLLQSGNVVAFPSLHRLTIYPVKSILRHNDGVFIIPQANQ